ncbi:sulfatase-like hydrolase/transferase, partial [Proteus myxofaciens]|uniref:sulfatase-like hydrolase/transferase n=1 Tax=Proteus myxofaciens TaxID=184072 RepID=UPI00316AC1B0
RLKNKPFILLLLYIYPIYATSSIFINADKKLLSDFDEDPNFKSSMIRDRFPIVFGNIIYLLTAMNSTDKYVDNFDIEKINPSITGKKKPENKLVILVMGESSLDSRYSAYGYPIKTTPNIDRIFSEPDSCIIKNVHSSAPLTRNSISMS